MRKHHIRTILTVCATVAHVATASAQLTREGLEQMLRANRDGVVFKSFIVTTGRFDDTGNFFCGSMLAEIPPGKNTFVEVDYAAQIFPDTQYSAKTRSVIKLVGPMFPKENQDYYNEHCKYMKPAK